MIGQSLGPYRVLAKIGEGGMGEVYRATDTHLGRQVAIKVLPDAFAQDGERVARFEREAKTLAALNHPNIAAIYGVEHSNGVRAPLDGARGAMSESRMALVMELVEGPTLADRIARGPIPIDEALPIARQIAEALEAAHEQGIVHRDLKPANIKIKDNGTVKVLDFGLAKAIEPTSAALDISHSPTVTSPAMTQMGVILGTAAYMSPEQARGRPVDKRTDIWAFGCVLYEMLTSRRAFDGTDVADTLVAVLTRAVDVRGMPESTPASITWLVRRCLERDPARRLRDIGDARIALEDASEGSPLAASGVNAPSRQHVIRTALPWALTAVMTASVIGLAWQVVSRESVRSDGPVSEFAIDLPKLFSSPDIALSSDGRHIVYIGSTADGRPVLYHRSLRDTSVRELSGTEGAASPFFSPDAEWVGFHAEGELRRVPITGGRPTLICRAPEAVGASWGTNGSIVFGTLNEGLFQVSVAAGGTPSRLSKPESQGESHVYPEVLPDHRTVLFTVVPVDRAVSRIGVLSLDRPGEWQSLIDGFKPSYSPTGHLLFARPAALMAAPFDLGKRRISAEPAVVIPQLSISQGGPGDASYEISAAGRLIFLTGNPLASSRLVWVDRQGREVPAVERQEAGYLQPAISPTGNRLAMSRRQGDGDTRVWTYDLADGRSVPVVLGSSLSTWPVWSPDGKWIAFVSNRAEGWNVFRAPADGSGHAEQLTFDPLLRTTPTSWSVDDVLALERGPIGHRDILVLSMGKGSKPEPLVATEAHEHGARFSPDGRWLAFNSDRSGQDEVWVKAFPGNDSPVPISIGGGREPVWSRNGRELFYRNGNRMVSVPVTAGRPGKPTVLFEGDYSYGYLDWTLNYDVAADGRFLMVKEGPAPKLHVIVNWTEELKRLVPVN